MAPSARRAPPLPPQHLSHEQLFVASSTLSLTASTAAPQAGSAASGAGCVPMFAVRLGQCRAHLPECQGRHPTARQDQTPESVQSSYGRHSSDLKNATMPLRSWKATTSARRPSRVTGSLPDRRLQRLACLGRSSSRLWRFDGVLPQMHQARPICRKSTQWP